MKNELMRILSKYLVITIVFFILLSLIGFYLVTHPFKYISSAKPSDFGMKYEAVEFKTEDNVKIRGWFIPNKNPNAKTVILLHGYPASKGDILPSRLFLHEDFNLLFFDFRYMGESGGKYSTIAINELLDLRGALDYLHKKGIDKVGVWGFSVGGAVIILGSKNKEVRAIVAEAPFARLDWMANDYYNMPGFSYVMGYLFRLWTYIFLQTNITAVQPVNIIQHIETPLLLIYYRQDQVISYKHALLMQNAAKYNPKVTFILIEKGGHGALPSGYQKVIKDFFIKNLR